MKISENVKKVLIVSGVVLAAGLLIYYAGPPAVRLFMYLFGLVSPFIFGYITARLINPLADRLQKWLKIPRGISVVLVLLVTLVVVFGLIALLGIKMVNEIRNLLDDWPQILASLRENWTSLTDSWSRMYIEMPQSVQAVVDNVWTDLYAKGIELTKNLPVVDTAQVVAKSLPAGLIWTVMFILSTFFMVSQKNTMTGTIHKIFGDRAVNKIREIKTQCKIYLWGYVKAQLILMVIVFFVILVILSLFDAPFSLLVAAITAFLDALPFFGSGIVLWPMAAVYFIDKNIKLALVYVVTYFAIMLLRRFIEPKLVSAKMGFNPILTLIAMYIGYKIWGIVGLIVGPLLLMLIFSLYKVGLFHRPVNIIKQLGHFAVKEIKLFEKYFNDIIK